MIVFIERYWLLIIVVLSAVFEIIASLVVIFQTPKNKRSKALIEVLESIPSFINQAEALLVGASKKKSFVLSRCINRLCELTSYKKDKVEKLFITDLSDAIEETLSTPQKKGN